MRVSEGGQLGHARFSTAGNQRKHEQSQGHQQRSQRRRRWLAHALNALHEAGAATLFHLGSSLVAGLGRVPVLELEQLEHARHQDVSALAVA